MQGQGDRVTNLRLVDGAAGTPARTASSPRPSTRTRSTRRRRAFGKIAKQRSGRYQASYLDPHGTRIFAKVVESGKVLPLTFLDKKTAEAWLSLRQAELIENRWKPALAREPEEVGFAEYAEKTIKGAISVPYKEKSAKEAGFDAAQDQFDLARLPANKAAPLVFFCNSGECWKSYKASVVAQKAGYSKISWFRGGFPEWNSKGLPTQ